MPYRVLQPPGRAEFLRVTDPRSGRVLIREIRVKAFPHPCTSVLKAFFWQKPS
jgi:hypothetical protein